MFVLLPDGYQVMGAGLATMLSNVATLCYFIAVYRRVSAASVLKLPRRVERIRRESARSLYAVGVPAALSLFLFDLTNIVINRLSAFHGDVELAAMGIVQKVERLPLNTGIGICLGMVPLVAYNYAAKNEARMKAFFAAGRFAGLTFSLLCVVLYRVFAADIIRAFIADAETVRLGTQFLRARCFATPLMFLSFHMVHFMQAVGQGRVSFWLAAIRQLALNIPLLFLLNRLFGMSGVVWTQATADFLNVIASYIIYFRVIGTIRQTQEG
jgi:Na+-driven multidrug efflux pump